MVSIVEEIQRDALNSGTSLSDLLRKARVVASKLNQMQPLEWVDSELNGYTGEVPDYRILYGQAKMRNPYHGWQPFMIGDGDLQKSVCGRHIQSPIRELEHFVSSEGDMAVPLSDEQSCILCRMAGAPTLPIVIFLPKNGAIRILDTVRTKILDWSLSLQAAGIEGEGLSFSPEEKAVANNPNVTYHIGNISNFSGNLGGNVGRNVHASSPQQVGAELDKAADLVKQIRGLNGQLGLTAAAEREMLAHVSAFDEECRKPAPERGRLAGLLRSIRAVCEGASGNVIAAGIGSLASNIHF